MRPKNPFRATSRLEQLYRQRAPDLTQDEFAAEHKIGTGVMLGYLINGKKPLSIEAAVKLARALGCTIYDICPPMAKYLESEVVPVLGKALRRVAVVLLAVTLSLFQLPDAKASLAQIRPFNIINTHCRVFRYFARLLAKMCAFTHTCAAPTAVPASIPA